MVKDYLVKYQSLLLEEKINCENEYKRLEQRLKEDIEFRCLLEEKNDPNFEAFTPHEINSKNKEKIKELELDEEQIRVKQEDLLHKISDYENRLNELGDIITVAGENERAQESLKKQTEKAKEERFKLLETEEEGRQYISDYLKNSVLQNLLSLQHKIELCSNLIDLEPVRCKMEIASLSKMAENILQEVNSEVDRLHSISFDDEFDFYNLLKEELEKMSASSDIEINFNSEGEQSNIRPVIGITLLRSILDVCSNSLERQANQISVRLICEVESITVQIAENGKQQEFEQKYLEIERRINLLSGSMNLDSTMEENVIQIDVPLI